MTTAPDLETRSCHTPFLSGLCSRVPVMPGSETTMLTERLVDRMHEDATRPGPFPRNELATEPQEVLPSSLTAPPPKHQNLGILRSPLLKKYLRDSLCHHLLLSLPKYSWHMWQPPF